MAPRTKSADQTAERRPRATSGATKERAPRGSRNTKSTEPVRNMSPGTLTRRVTELETIVKRLQSSARRSTKRRNGPKAANAYQVHSNVIRDSVVSDFGDFITQICEQHSKSRQVVILQIQAAIWSAYGTSINDEKHFHRTEESSTDDDGNTRTVTRLEPVTDAILKAYRSHVKKHRADVEKVVTDKYSA